MEKHKEMKMESTRTARRATFTDCEHSSMRNGMENRKIRPVWVGSNVWPYIHTRILGPPKAGHENRHKMLIILKSNILKILIFVFLENFVF